MEVYTSSILPAKAAGLAVLHSHLVSAMLGILILSGREDMNRLGSDLILGNDMKVPERAVAATARRPIFVYDVIKTKADMLVNSIVRRTPFCSGLKRIRRSLNEGWIS